MAARLDPGAAPRNSAAVGMRSLAHLAGLSVLLWAQSYRPWLFGGGIDIPTGRWAARKGNFPEAGYVEYGYSFFLTKEYYAPKGQVGWFVFGRPIEWRLMPEFRSALTAPRVIALPDSQTPLPHPQSLQGGAGIVFRKAWGLWAFTAPIDLHIISVAYPPYQEFSAGGEQLLIRISSNTFLGTGVGLTLQRRMPGSNTDAWGVGLYCPLSWGVPSIVTRIYTAADGKKDLQRSPYYLRPTHFNVRLFMAVVL